MHQWAWYTTTQSVAKYRSVKMETQSLPAPCSHTASARACTRLAYADPELRADKGAEMKPVGEQWLAVAQQHRNAGLGGLLMAAAIEVPALWSLD